MSNFDLLKDKAEEYLQTDALFTFIDEPQDDFVYKNDDESFQKFIEAFREDATWLMEGFLEFLEEEPIKIDSTEEENKRALYLGLHKNEIDRTQASDTEPYESFLEILKNFEGKTGVKSLPLFEDCGSCAWAVINTEYKTNLDVKGVVTFNYQTFDTAEQLGTLYLTVAGFNGKTDSQVVNELKTILETEGYKEILPEKIEKRMFNFKDFAVTDYGIIVADLWNKRTVA